MTSNQPSNQPQTREIKSLLSELAAETVDWNQAGATSIPDIMAGWVTPQYLLAIRTELTELPAGSERLGLLRQAAHDAVAFQRGDCWRGRLQLDHKKLEFQEKKLQRAVAAESAPPKPRRDPKLPLSDEDRLAIIAKVDEIMGLK